MERPEEVWRLEQEARGGRSVANGVRGRAGRPFSALSLATSAGHTPTAQPQVSVWTRPDPNAGQHKVLTFKLRLLTCQPRLPPALCLARSGRVGLRDTLRTLPANPALGWRLCTCCPPPAESLDPLAGPSSPRPCSSSAPTAASSSHFFIYS